MGVIGGPPLDASGWPCKKRGEKDVVCGVLETLYWLAMLVKGKNEYCGGQGTSQWWCQVAVLGNAVSPLLVPSSNFCTAVFTVDHTSAPPSGSQ